MCDATSACSSPHAAGHLFSCPVPFFFHHPDVVSRGFAGRMAGSNMAVSLTNLINSAESFVVHSSRSSEARVALQVRGLPSGERLRMGTSDSTSGSVPW